MESVFIKLNGSEVRAPQMISYTVPLRGVHVIS